MFMKINVAHIRERSTSGGWINFAVFEANSNNGTDSGRAEVLRNLTIKARANGLQVEKSALAYNQSGRTMFYGTPDLVDYLSNSGVPRWTHSLDI
jgi:uncharacterized protein YjiK